MGNTKSGLRKSPYLSISLQKKSFFISEPIQGTIILQSNPQLQISDINISLNLLEGWTVSKVRRGDIFYDSDNDEKYDREFNFTPQITFNLNIQNKNFNNGNYTFPFIIYTNNLTFPSFEYPKFQVRGYLRYIITAGIVPLIPNNPILEYCDEFIQIKSLPLILNTPLSSSSNVHVEKWGLMDKGNTSLYCSISKNIFCIGENIPISINVDNTNGKMDVNEIKISIHRLVNLCPCKSKEKYNFDDTIIRNKYKVLIPKGQSHNCNYDIKVYDFKIKVTKLIGEEDPLNKGIDVNDYVPTCISKLVKCEYNLKVSVYFSSYTTKNSRPRCVIPISIGHNNSNQESPQIINNMMNQIQFIENKNNDFPSLEEIENVQKQNINNNPDINNNININNNNPNINNNNINNYPCYPQPGNTSYTAVEINKINNKDMI